MPGLVSSLVALGGRKSLGGRQLAQVALFDVTDVNFWTFLVISGRCCDKYFIATFGRQGEAEQGEINPDTMVKIMFLSLSREISWKYTAHIGIVHVVIWYYWKCRTGFTLKLKSWICFSFQAKLCRQCETKSLLSHRSVTFRQKIRHILSFVHWTRQGSYLFVYYIRQRTPWCYTLVATCWSQWADSFLFTPQRDRTLRREFYKTWHWCVYGFVFHLKQWHAAGQCIVEEVNKSLQSIRQKCKINFSYLYLWVVHHRMTPFLNNLWSSYWWTVYSHCDSVEDCCNQCEQDSVRT